MPKNGGFVVKATAHLNTRGEFSQSDGWYAVEGGRSWAQPYNEKEPIYHSRLLIFADREIAEKFIKQKKDQTDKNYRTFPENPIPFHGDLTIEEATPELFECFRSSLAVRKEKDFKCWFERGIFD